MDDRRPTVRSRELGEGLRRAMEYGGYNQTTIAHRLGWSQGRVSRLLAGKRGGNGYDVAGFVAVCGIPNEEKERLMALCLDYDKPGWFLQHGPVVPMQVITLIDYETKTTSIDDFQTTLVHGLLQTGHYAREVIIHNVNLPLNEIEDRVQARLARQSVLSRNRPPRCIFYMHEFVLRTPVGGPAVMSDQLHHLLRVSVRPGITIRVVETKVGAHAGMSGPFTLMNVPQFKPIVYLDSEISSLFLETPIEIDAYRNILSALEEAALDEGQSRQLITSLAEAYEADREDHDDLAEEQLER
jgi:transcriptional regulator with XRE-family HTH domain